MGINDSIILILAGILLMALVVFLIWKNQKDKKLINPDSEDAVKELHMDQDRRTDKI